MYLKRFGRPNSKGHQISVAKRDLAGTFTASIRDVAVESGFYWGTDPDGVPHHHIEEFFSVLEGSATTAFRFILDKGKGPFDDALPAWPPRLVDRISLSWWIAAQILRTVRQRSRLAVDAHRTGIDLPDKVAVANHHLDYIAALIEPLAATIFARPWGIGFSDYCLLTGDVPVLVLNGQDHADQRTSVAYWDVYLPLDPHRCLYLPGAASEQADGRLRRDHRLKLHPGHGMGLNGAMMDASVRHVFFHPEHDPTSHTKPGRDVDSALPQFLMNYSVLPPDLSVERRWLVTHAGATEGSSPATQSINNDQTIKVATEMLGELERRGRQYRSITRE